MPGHWEGDLIFGSKNSQIATLVERQTRYLMMAKVNSKDTETVINALIKHAHQLPKELYTSLTGIAARTWLITNASLWQPISRCTSVTRRTLGNGARMRTPMACFGSTFPKERTCRFTRKPS